MENFAVSKKYQNLRSTFIQLFLHSICHTEQNKIPVINVKSDFFKIIFIVKYRDHPSIVAIRNKCNRIPYFIFPNVSAEEITKEIRKLDPSKASHDNDIPTKIIKENADIFSEFICMSVNHSIDNNIFPSTLKLANITPVFKKGSANSKENHRPVSILPNLSKIFERCMFKPNVYVKLL